MSDVVYGFRPESAWPGVLFQVFLKGNPFWQKQKELAYWLSFGGASVKAVFYEMDSTVSWPDIGTKRYVLQCLVPEAIKEGPKIPVNLNVHGPGGKTLAQALFLGLFEYKESGTSFVCISNLIIDGTMLTYNYFGNMVHLMEWLQANPPKDIHLLSLINREETCHNGEVVGIVKYQDQLSQGSIYSDDIE